MPELIRSDGGLLAQATKVKLCHDTRTLRIRFDCEDKAAWSTFTRRDEPIHHNEVVAIALAPGADTPSSYYEFALSPGNVQWDARVTHTDQMGSNVYVNNTWKSAAYNSLVQRDDLNNRWYCWLGISLRDMCADGVIPELWRANIYRIDRPPGVTDIARAEVSTWAAINLASLPPVHSFGTLRLL